MRLQISYANTCIFYTCLQLQLLHVYFNITYEYPAVAAQTSDVCALKQARASSDARVLESQLPHTIVYLVFTIADQNLLFTITV